MSENKNLKEEYVPLKSRISVSGADGIVAFAQTIIGGGTLTYYFTTTRGLDPIYSVIVLSLFGFWNIINDPIFGSISDRTRHKLGRRIPYIRYGGPILGLSYILCWLPIPGTESNQLIMFFQFLITLFLYDTLYTAVATSLYVMPYEMAVSNKARGTIFIWKVIFSVFAMATPLFILPALKPSSSGDLTFYILFHIILGIAVGAIVFLSTFFYEEKVHQRQEEPVPFIDSLKKTLTNKSFLIFEIISFTIIYVQSGLMFGLFYYTDELETNFLALILMLIVGVFVGVYLFIIKGHEFGVKKSMQIMLASFSAGCFLILILGRFLIPTMIGFIGIGMGLCGGLYLIPMMNGDVIDYDESVSGERREGMYAGVNSFVTKYAINLAQSAFLLIIGAFGYISTESMVGNQDSLAETGIIIGWMLIPALLLFVCFIAMYWYPLDGPEWQGTKQKLAQIHEAKEKARLEELGIKYEE
ncbi:MAG: conserved membrane protein of unknown function [Promethearchaeota archaeon]|nr:MAG: conserved membrane protein of unknown function [Candidatus Lokiarchaeota archaeon]